MPVCVCVVGGGGVVFLLKKKNAKKKKKKIFKFMSNLRISFAY